MFLRDRLVIQNVNKNDVIQVAG